MTISTFLHPPLILLVVLLATGCGGTDGNYPTGAPESSVTDGATTYSAADRASDVAAVRALLDEQVRLWNAGDIDGFMAYYWRSDSLRFASRGDVRYGWQASLDSYKENYPNRAAMGSLAFEDLDIRSLSPKWIAGFGRFRLTRSEELGDLTGLFTLLLRRTDEGWRIVHDHTSD